MGIHGRGAAHLRGKGRPRRNPGGSVCDPHRRCIFDFAERRSWRNLTPKLGLQHWSASGTRMVYGHYTKGFRSGGYNLRNTSPVAPPGPFDEEEQDSFEVGIKAESAGGRLRLNLAVFHNRVYDLQRQVTRADVATGGVQVTANTADATIEGVEAEVVAVLPTGWSLGAFLCYLDGTYDEVRFDLDHDGSTEGDEDLDLPRLAKLSYGAQARFTRGRLSVRLALTHRDDIHIAGDNRGVLDGGDLVEASIAYRPSDSLGFTVYGRNLLNEVLRQSGLDLTGLVDSTYSPLKEGRVLGFEVRGRL